ncbi:hypothetical protein MTR67_010608 [Solanum verrucosum]|uniref:Uncharacterized protein n=1 Tax=Solanum verrucosum TaxID=315347 RepID=A0AAF0Q6H1_SOLVR|nr:hypothetical protein MTR67_010608 [Solanum verrucosum]
MVASNKASIVIVVLGLELSCPLLRPPPKTKKLLPKTNVLRPPPPQVYREFKLTVDAQIQ